MNEVKIKLYVLSGEGVANALSDVTEAMRREPNLLASAWGQLHELTDGHGEVIGSLEVVPDNE